MNKSFCLLIAFLLVSTPANATGFSQSSICVERPENNGILNIRPATILFSNGQSLTLYGGEESCISVKPGEYTAKAESKDPYDINNTKPWASGIIKLNVQTSETIVLKLTRDHSAEVGWRLKPRK